MEDRTITDADVEVIESLSIAFENYAQAKADDTWTRDPAAAARQRQLRNEAAGQIKRELDDYVDGRVRVLLAAAGVKLPEGLRG